MATAPNPGFDAPGVEDFQLPPIFGDVTKPVLQLVLAAIIVYAFFAITSRRAQLVPGKAQFLGESLHGLVRNSIARDNIGPDFLKYVPYLTTLFAFILVNNLFGIIPFIQFPTFSHPGVPLRARRAHLADLQLRGIRKHGFMGYVRVSTWPPGVPWWVRIVLTPIEFLSNILLRPVTLSLRLFGNMFAGHLLLLVFILGGEYMLLHSEAIFLQIASPFAFALGIVFTFFEAFIQVVQAYVFTILTASYIGTVLAEEH
ncbi:ATP synthase F0 subunit A [Pseudonocardia sp. CNS-139]|nr:ATP synthase F0 subunit A [Pseudonocardia sp. CNS-139]